MNIQPANDMDLVRTLFREYQQELAIDLCFQSFEAELAALPGAYAPPDGALLILWSGETPMGCVALRRSAEGIGEMKRLYVRSAARGTGQGRALANAIIEAARQAGYQRLRLDTLPQMTTAIAMYRAMGFQPTERYYASAPKEALFFELSLA